MTRLSSFTLVTLAALLTACGALSTKPVSFVPGGEAAAVRTSWMLSRAAKSSNLLYVSNASNVAVYSYNDGTGIQQVGELTGFLSPKGLCADKAGNVWVADYGARAMYEYAHGGTSPIRTIQHHTGFPDACAIDPTSDDLAVSWEHPNAKFEIYADVYVYPNERGPGKIYNRAGGFFSSIYFLTYDAGGELFADASPCYDSGCYYHGGPPGLFVLPARFKGFQQITIDGATLYQPSAVVWVNPALLLVDRNFENGGRSGAYKLLATKAKATVVGSLSLTDTEQSYGVTVRAGLVIAPDASTNTVRIYRLSDDTLVSSFTQGLDSPYAAVVSQATKK